MRRLFPERGLLTEAQKQRRNRENWKAVRIIALLLLFTPVGNVLFYAVTGHWPSLD